MWPSGKGAGLDIRRSRAQVLLWPLSWSCFLVDPSSPARSCLYWNSELVGLPPVLCLVDIFVSLSLSGITENWLVLTKRTDHCENLTLKILTYETASGTRVSSVEKTSMTSFPGANGYKRKITRWLEDIRNYNDIPVKSVCLFVCYIQNLFNFQICGLSLLLVLTLLRGFFSGFSGFPLSTKTNTSKF